MTRLAPKDPTLAFFQADIETTSDRLVCRWGDKIKRLYNPIDEEILLKIFNHEGRFVADCRIEHLSQKEIALEPGTYSLEIARFFRPEVELRSSIYPTPTLFWNQDSASSRLIAWSGLDWDAIRHEVTQVHGVDWDEETSVALRVLWNRPEGLVNQWIPVPQRHHITLEGQLEEVELAVIGKPQEDCLKSLFLAKLAPRQPLQVLWSQSVSIVAPQPQLRLLREVIETDTLQLRAQWTEVARQPLYLSLWQGQVLIDKQGPVPTSGNWLFNGLESGTYTVELRDSQDTKTPALATSPQVHLPKRPTRVRLLPINERRAFAYWHVDRDVWINLAKELGDLDGRVRTYLQLGIRVGSEIRQASELTRAIDTGSTDDYYLDLAPDRIYHARLLAVIDHEQRYFLTEWSNPCQLGRLQAGHSPITHKKVRQPSDHPTVRSTQGPTQIARHSLGYLLIHLHAHLPFIADPVNFGNDHAWRPMGYPQEWYPEAVCDTYLPLLDTFETLYSENVDFKLSMDISPPLAAMMTNQRHAADVLAFLERLIKLARLEVERTGREESHFQAAALMHLRRYKRCRDLFLAYDGDLAQAFAKFEGLGHLELSSCVGTHPMLPLWMSEPQAIRGHCLAAAHAHETIFGRRASGVWLPECAYTPGVEPFLEEAGFRFSFGENHCLTRADAPAEFGVNAPAYCKGSSLAIFPRDPETGEQVWSGDQGYPGDPDYLEFHIRGGPFKYNRITDRRGGHKEPYQPTWAEKKAADHAGHFLTCRNARFDYLRHTMWKKPLIVAPYDAELFGHHWYEGPRFLYYLFKKIHYDQNMTELVTPSSYLATNPTCQDVYANVSSWGDKGTFEKWMYGSTSWMYRHGHEAASHLGLLCRQGADNALQHRLLAQAARQLMIATSSDLPFVISNGHFIDRMKDQFFGNLSGFYDLCTSYERSREGASVDETVLRSLELENSLMPDLDPQWFASR